MWGGRVWAGVVAAALLAVLGPGAALGAGPRYVTGPPYFTGAPGQPIGWKQTQVRYWTDPGGLGPAVNHAAADALVAAAAGVWNVPVANIGLSQGGTLAEHASGGNVFLGANGMAWPADVDAANAAAVPIAVVYDTDGSVTETLLGGGASSVSSCRQNAVTESVDGFDPAGYITHAVIVLNGRCTGAAAAMQTEMQYKLVRAFGRVLGLAWSQANDNVFTGMPVPTYEQALHWPLMHPVEIICGAYSYQCLPQPFVLRPDDVSGLVGLYPVRDETPLPARKQPSRGAAFGVQGTVSFPTGQGMAGVNIVVRREAVGSPVVEGWVESSAVSGVRFRTNGQSPFVAADASAAGSWGNPNPWPAGNYEVSYVPLGDGLTWANGVVSLEAVNGLYTGPYSVGPYGAGTVDPSGAIAPETATVVGMGPGLVGQQNFLVGDAAATCGTGQDGTADVPMAMPGTGWWDGLLCGVGHVSYVRLNVRPARSLTVEVTAEDEAGLATMAKAMPVVGLFGPEDGAYALPSVGVAATAFQALGVGTTTLSAETGQMTAMRLGIADQRGDGRPDYGFGARVLYADSVVPAQVLVAGGSVAIAGTGFRAGDRVKVNGVAAAVTASDANTLTVTVPAMSVARATLGAAVDVEVWDAGTGGTTRMYGALRYSTTAEAKKQMKVVTAPVGNVAVGAAAAVPFAVQVVGGDGVTPVAGEAVVFVAGPGTVKFGGCGAGACTVMTDATGVAQVTVTPGAAGAVTLEAEDGGLREKAAFVAVDAGLSMVVVGTPEGRVKVGTRTQGKFEVKVQDAWGSWVPGQTVLFRVTAGTAALSGCFSATCAVTTDSQGHAGLYVTALAEGTVTVEAEDGLLRQSATLTAANDFDLLRTVSLPASPVVAGQYTGHFDLQLLLSDGVTPDWFENVEFTASPGMMLSVCGAASCAIMTNSQGYVGTMLIAEQPGTYTVRAAYGTVEQTATITFTAKATMQMQLLSAPAGDQPVGAAADRAFAVRVEDADGMPLRSVLVAMGGAQDAVKLGECAFSFCTLTTDGDGVASTTVIALRAGPVALSATFSSLTVAARFNAVDVKDTMYVVASPGPGTFAGDAETLTVQVLGHDGVTPAAGRVVSFAVTEGRFGFAACSGMVCTAVTDARGMATVVGTAPVAGAVEVVATDGPVAKTMSFVTAARPGVMRLVRAPTGDVPVGDVARDAFTVQVMKSDGHTPDVGHGVTFAVTQGSARFGVCPAAPCAVTADANGMVSTTVTPLAVGAVGMVLSDGLVWATAGINGVGKPDVLRMVSVPGGDGFAGTVEATAFVVQVLLADGVTPAVGRNVTVAVTSGAAGLGACGGAATCAVVADGNGMVRTTVTPAAAGTVSLQVTDGGVTLVESFNVRPRPETMQTVAAPGGNVFVGSASGVFSVRVVAGDGVTPVGGRAVVFSASGGRVVMGACGAATCTVMTGVDGVASTTATPLDAGGYGLLATEGGLTAAAGFTAVARPNVMRVVSVPADGALVGDLAGVGFAVRVVLADGVTAVAGEAVTFGVTGGAARLGGCGAGCVVVTDGAGLASVGVTPTGAGTVGLAATYAGTTVNAGFLAVAKADLLRVVSAPADGALVGDLAAVAFAVRVVLGDGVTAGVGKAVTFGVTGGSARLSGCGAGCVVLTDAAGVASVGVTPLGAGAVGLEAADGAVVQGVAFVAVDKPDTLRLVGAPADGALVGDVAGTAFAVKVVAGDGVTADAGKTVTLSVAGGTLGACGGASCAVTTDALGVAQSSVTPGSAGVVRLGAVAGTASVRASFVAVGKADRMELVSAPGAGVFSGESAGAPFAVRVVLGDGVSPAAGVGVVFSATGAGGVVFGACGGAVCRVVTGVDGVASTGVTGVGVGVETLVATADAATGALPVLVGFAVKANVRSVVAAGGAVYVAEGATFAGVLGVLATSNGAPGGGVAVQWTGGSGLMPGVGSTVTDGAGRTEVGAMMGPLGAGVGASATACAWTDVCAEFGAVGVGEGAFRLEVVSGGAQAVGGAGGAGGAAVPVVVLLSDGAGHPVAGGSVSVFETVTAVSGPCPVRGRCPAAPVLETRARVVTTGGDGLVTVVVLDGGGVAAETKVEFAAGPNGVAMARVTYGP